MDFVVLFVAEPVALKRTTSSRSKLAENLSP